MEDVTSRESIASKKSPWTIVTIPDTHQVTNIGKNRIFFNLMIIRMFCLWSRDVIIKDRV